jgi:hypothetical protein
MATVFIVNGDHRCLSTDGKAFQTAVAGVVAYTSWILSLLVFGKRTLAMNAFDLIVSVLLILVTRSCHAWRRGKSRRAVSNF